MAAPARLVGGEDEIRLADGQIDGAEGLGVNVGTGGIGEGDRAAVGSDGGGVGDAVQGGLGGVGVGECDAATVDGDGTCAEQGLVGLCERESGARIDRRRARPAASGGAIEGEGSSKCRKRPERDIAGAADGTGDGGVGVTAEKDGVVRRAEGERVRRGIDGVAGGVEAEPGNGDVFSQGDGARDARKDGKIRSAVVPDRGKRAGGGCAPVGIAGNCLSWLVASWWVRGSGRVGRVDWTWNSWSTWTENVRLGSLRIALAVWVFPPPRVGWKSRRGGCWYRRRSLGAAFVEVFP